MVPHRPGRWKDQHVSVTGSEQPAPGSSAGSGAAGAARLDPWLLPDVAGLVVGILGGTGEQGRGLGLRLARAGQRVLIGSRDGGRAAAAAAELGSGVVGEANDAVAAAADLVIAAVPYAGHAQLLAGLARSLAGKILVDCVNPLGFDERGAYPLAVPEGSAAQQAAALLPDTRVVAAFHHVSAVMLLDLTLERVVGDVMVVGDDRSATDTVAALAGRIPGMRGIYAGRLRTAAALEALTANLIAVNRRYRVHAGLLVTDLAR